MRSVLDGDTSDNTFYNQKQNPKQDLMIAYLFSIRRQKKCKQIQYYFRGSEKNYLKKIEKNYVTNLYK